MQNDALDTGPSSIFATGVIARRAFARGETVHIMTGRRLPHWRCVVEVLARRLRLDDPLQINAREFFALNKLSIRFNHSCEPNAAIRGESELFALRDIAEGDEVTFDYSLTVSRQFYTRFWQMPCNCGAASCRKLISDIYSVPPGRRQWYIEQGAVQDYMVHKLYRSPWNWTKFRPGPPPPLPGKDHQVFLKGGKTGVLLLHGLSGTPVEMREAAEAMAAQGHTVLCPQLAGHCGTFDDLKAVRWQDWAASAEAGLKRLCKTCDTVTVGGLSTGAVLALDLAARFPDKVQGVIALAPTLWLNGWMVPYHAYLFNIVLQKPVANLFDHPDMPPHGIKDEAIRHRIKSAIQSGDSSLAGLAVTPGGAVLEHRWLVNSVRRDMKWIKQPVLIVHPREDDYADLNNVAEIIRSVRGPVETMTLDDSYHIITVDRQRHLVFERLASFVAKVAASTIQANKIPATGTD